ncbi:MAG: polysaccharide deacetylase family protein, partial [Pseudomonadota bacterium]
HVISMEQLVDQLERGEPIQRGTVVITFDDGYLNNLTVAAPILAKYNLPATIYLATHAIETGENQWIDTLYATFRARSQHQLNLPALKNKAPNSTSQWDLTRESEQRAAYGAIVGYLIEASVEQKQQLLATLYEQLAPTATPPRLTMNWDEVRQLQQQYPNITLGVHTVNHLDLSIHTEQTTAEVQTSVQQVEQATGQRPEHLAFPYNRYNDRVIELVKAANIRSAVAEGGDVIVHKGSNRYSLARLDGPQSLTMLKSWTNGSFPALSQRLLRQYWDQPH